MTWPRAVLALTALGFAGFGFAFLLFPARIAALVDIVLTTPTAATDLRATYGGFEIGFAAFLAWCAAERTRVRIGLLAGAFALAGFAGGRVYGFLADGLVEPLLLAALALEAGGAVVCALGARAAGRPAD